MDTKEIKYGGFPAWCIWAMATIFVIYLFNVQTGYSIVNPMVQKDIGLSLKQVGLIASIYTWAFAFCQFFGGALLDKLGSRKVIVPGIALVTLGLYVFSIADSFSMLLVSQLILALGSCVGFVGAGFVGGQWFGMAKYGIMFGLVQTVASLSSAFGQTGFALALHAMTWRELGMHGVYFGILLLIIAAIWLKNPPWATNTDYNFTYLSPTKLQVKFITTGNYNVISNIIKVAKIPHIWICSFWGAICFGSQLALGVVWAPKILAAHNMDVRHATLGAAMIWLGLAIGCLFWNGWSEHIQQRKLPAIVGLGVQLLALFGILTIPLSFFSCMIAMFVYGMGSAGHMIAFSSAADVVEPSQIGTSASVVNGSMFIAGGIMMSLPGYLLPKQEILTLQNYTTAFLPFLVLLAVSLLVAIVQKETYPNSDK